jgi:lysophospholipase L1-like esterase
MSCLLAGDSIAVGLATAMPECQMRARSGITSTRYLQSLAIPLAAQLVVISLGANDWHLATFDNLCALRRLLTASRIVWLLPNIQRPGVRDAILRVAAMHGDSIVDTVPFVGTDHVHPDGRGYAAIAGLARSHAEFDQSNQSYTAKMHRMEDE